MTAMTTPATGTTSDFGAQLRYWRSVRHVSQLGLASDAGTTPRYVSFVETGRAQPSRHMVLRLARALDVPLRERNDLLLAAGYAPVYGLSALGSGELARVDEAIGSMLAQHEPFPAVVLDRGWDVVRANQGAARLFGTLLAPEPIPDDANVLRLVVGPGPVRDSVVNWSDVVPALLDRARREAVGGVADPATVVLLDDLRSRPEVREALVAAPVGGVAAAPVVDVRFAFEGAVVGFFSVVATIGTPIDVTAQELRLELFFPSTPETRTTWT
ncbi:MAG TPA: helix-turn-helix transcriptional regulator, partial [Acidimicrobiales bacterium]